MVPDVQARGQRVDRPDRAAVRHDQHLFAGVPGEHLIQEAAHPLGERLEALRVGGGSGPRAPASGRRSAAKSSSISSMVSPSQAPKPRSRSRSSSTTGTPSRAERISAVSRARARSLE